MAGTTIAMSKLKQVLRWKEEGYSNRKIAQLVGLNKETVNNYISRAKADSLSQKELLQLDDYVLDIRLRGGNAAYTDTRFEVFKKHLPYFVEQMADPHNHVTLYVLNPNNRVLFLIISMIYRGGPLRGLLPVPLGKPREVFSVF